MYNKVATLFLLGFAISIPALLVEKFTNNQIDYVPGASGGLAPNAVNGYLFTYANTGSHVYKMNTTTEITTSVLAQAATYQSPNGLGFDLVLGGTAADKYAGLGFQFLKPGGTQATPIYYPADLSTYSSIIVRYKSNRAINLEWQQDDTEDDGAAFFCELPAKATEGDHTCLLSLQTDSSLGFKQPYWASGNAIKTFDKATAIGLKFMIKSGANAQVVLKGVYLDNTDTEWPVSSEALSSSENPSSSVDISSSAELPSSSATPSSSSIALVASRIWEPALVNQVELDGVGGGFWYGYASTSPAGSFTPSDFTTINGPISSSLNPGGTNGFAAIGFDWVDNGTGTTKGSVDLSTKQSVCISYTASKAVTVMMKQSNLPDNCAQYVLSLPIATTTTTAELMISGFKKEGSWGNCTATQDLTKQTGVHIQNKTTPAASIKIYKIGFDGYCGTPGVILGKSSSAGSSSVGSSSAPSSSSKNLSSSSNVLSSSSKTLSSSGTSSSNSVAQFCNTILQGHTDVWMLEDDNKNGVPNYNEPRHPCYQGTSTILAGSAKQGFGIERINRSEIQFRTSHSGAVAIAIYSTDGRQLQTLYSGNAAQGFNTIRWNSAGLRNGLYHVRITQGSLTKTAKVVLK